jgi:hypothetical protein
VDGSTHAVLEALGADLARLWEDVARAELVDLEMAEGMVRDGVLAIGARVLSRGRRAGVGPG